MNGSFCGIVEVSFPMSHFLEWTPWTFGSDMLMRVEWNIKYHIKSTTEKADISDMETFEPMIDAFT